MSVLALISGLLFAAFSHADTFHIPDRFDPKTAGILLVLHGCDQTPESMAYGSGLSYLAQRNNLVAVYPAVPRGSHPANCWGWWRPENQKPGSGQLKMIMDLVADTRKTLGLEHAKVYAVGFSAGGSMVANLLACYPNEFTAGAIHSGVSYGLAHSEEEAVRVMQKEPPEHPKTFPGPCDPSRFRGGLITIHGDGDPVVDDDHGERIMADFFKGAQKVERRDKDRNGVEFETTDYIREGKIAGRAIELEVREHAWSGSNLSRQLPGKAEVPFFSNHGPSSTSLIWAFFSLH